MELSLPPKKFKLGRSQGPFNEALNTQINCDCTIKVLGHIKCTLQSSLSQYTENSQYIQCFTL